MKTNIFIMLLLSVWSCNKKTVPSGTFFNTKYYIDAPINILSLQKEKTFSMTYPNVIGEKVLGTWEINKDTLVLSIKAELTNNFRDTLSKKEVTINKYLIKHGDLYSINNGWILKRR